MYKLTFLLICVVFHSVLLAQEYRITGLVSDDGTGIPLPFASLRISGSVTGTATNSNGKYELRLKKGLYTIVCSYVGYNTDSVTITVTQNADAIDLRLKPASVNLPEITVFPGENPALAVMRNAVERKKLRAALVNNYQYAAYTKSVILSTEHLDMRGGGFSVSLGVADSIPLSIGAIAETKSVGYFRAPNDYIEEIIARKQTANVPAFVNTLTGGRLVQNFYADRINFFGQPLYGPISQEALRYYYFQLKDTLASGNNNVFVVSIVPDDSLMPGFIGELFIQDKSFDLLKVELQLNRAANTGGFLDSIVIIQQFAPFDNIYMPVDYRLVLKANIFSLAKVGYELASIMNEYKINGEINSEKFGKAVVKVLPDADTKDSAFWASEQIIPLTPEEQDAYKSLDSIRLVPISVWDRFSLLSQKFDLSEYVAISAPLEMYRFNKVSGHALNYALDTKNLLNFRLGTGIALAYGFGSNRLDYSWSGEYKAGELRTTIFRAKVFQETQPLYAEKNDVGSFISTLSNILFKSEFSDYFYTSGALLSFASEITNEIKVTAGFTYTDAQSAVNNSSFSLFKSGGYKPNTPVTEVKSAILSVGADVDFRSFIEDGMFRRRTGKGSNYLLFGFTYFLSDTKLLKSDNSFNGGEIKFQGAVATWRKAKIEYRLSGGFSSGSLPVQNRFLLPGNINLISREQSFRTLPPSEFTSEQQVALFLEHQLRDELFLASGIDWLQKAELQLTHFINFGWSQNDDNSRQFRLPLIETGLLLSHSFIPVKLDIAFRVTHREENTFRFGIRVF